MTRMELIAYNPEWPRFFEEEASRLKPMWGQQLIAIHHIGSTAVPGLAAKPIIDIMVVIKDISTIHQFDSEMVSLGFRPKGESLGTPGRFYYRKDAYGLRIRQVHVMELGHFDIERKLAFRDYLLTHPAVAEAYADLKAALIRDNPSDKLEYVRGKSALIGDCIAKAIT